MLSPDLSVFGLLSIILERNNSLGMLYSFPNRGESYYGGGRPTFLKFSVVRTRTQLAIIDRITVA